MTKNNSVASKAWICAAIIAVVLVADQILKVWIKTNFPLGGDMPLIGEWCRLHFVENSGIAFGMSMGENMGKLFLTLFRLVASIVILVLLIRFIKKDMRYLLIISVSLIFVGAVGNLVDSCFYGVIFSESTHETIAELFPAGGGYGRLLYGKVVDMFYFPILHWTWPDWMPLVGGNKAEFFNAIFNIADSAVCIGVALLFIDQIWFSPQHSKSESNPSEESPISEETTSEE